MVIQGSRLLASMLRPPSWPRGSLHPAGRQGRNREGTSLNHLGQDAIAHLPAMRTSLTVSPDARVAGR